MEIGDVRWPALREASRRFLKTEGVVLEVPNHDRYTALKLVQSIADHIPERLELPQIRDGRHKGHGIFQLGGDAPTLDICWVPGEYLWNDFVETCMELLEAGYPGCEGCGGPGALEKWNEISQRENMAK